MFEGIIAERSSRVVLLSHRYTCSKYVELCNIRIEQNPKAKIAALIQNDPLFKKAQHFSIKTEQDTLDSKEMPKILPLLQLEQKLTAVVTEINALISNYSQFDIDLANDLIAQATLLENEYDKV